LQINLINNHYENLSILFIPLPLVLWGLFHLYGLNQISVHVLALGIYAVIFCFGVIRGFYSPSATSLKPFLIPRELYTNGATWTTIGWQSGVILGQCSVALCWLFRS
jgi:hypothetical protein